MSGNMLLSVHMPKLHSKILFLVCDFLGCLLFTIDSEVNVHTGR